MFDELARRSDELAPGPNAQRVRVGEGSIGAGQVGSHDDFREAAVDGLCLRARVQLEQPHPAARDVAGMGVHELEEGSVPAEVATQTSARSPIRYVASPNTSSARSVTRACGPT